ncbi:MAG: SO2930 family diheme c-type cytochrome, partial [Shewanella sp.]
MKTHLLLSALLAAISLLSACGGGDGQESSAPTPPPPPPSPEGACEQQSAQVNWTALMTQDCPRLSQYGLFSDPSNPTAQPRAPGVGYQLATQLFSNYATKYRFIYLPAGKTIQYQAQEVFDLPVGTVLVKTFSLPLDTALSGIANETLVETRLLIHRELGWTSLAYQWQQGEAKLLSTGATVRHTLVNQGQSQTFDYAIPSRAECKVCHQRNQNNISKIIPIGLKAHLLNKEITHQGQTVNQLSLWAQQGLLSALPPLAEVGKTFALNDTSADLTSRAKGYLDVNCAHCHSESGFASLSGLRLGFYVDHQSFQYGICKQPPGWDGGDKGLDYDIVPGNAEHSILLYR